MQSVATNASLWIDGVGGYKLCDATCFAFGSAMNASCLDASVFADIPGKAFTITTSRESTILNPETAGLKINGVTIPGPSILKNGDRITVLDRVGLQYRKPHPYSSTATLTLTTRHRWNHHVDGVVLLSHCCVIGNTTWAHIFNPNSDKEWMITRHENSWEISPHESTPSRRSSARTNKQVIEPMKRFSAEGIQLTLSVDDSL